jgi:hypothetical protein
VIQPFITCDSFQVFSLSDEQIVFIRFCTKSNVGFLCMGVRPFIQAFEKEEKNDDVDDENYEV